MNALPSKARGLLGSIRRRYLVSLRRRAYPLPDSEPIVSFTFDDFPRTSLEVGGTILRSYGAYGTYYVSMGLMGRTNILGELFNEDDLMKLLARGHELGSHTFNHLSCRSSSLNVFEADALNGRNAVISFTGRAEPHHFAYPYGHVTLKAKPRVGALMTSCRSIIGGINVSPVDLHLLRANNLSECTFDFDAIEHLLRLNDRRRGWLIFYTHDVRENPSPFGCTPRQFEAVVRLTTQLRARILTISRTLSTFRSSIPVNTSEACVK